MQAFTHRLVLAASLATTLATTGASQDVSTAALRENVFGALSWRPIGPVNFGGRIVDVAVHPTKSAEFYVAAATGGLFKTTNGGTTFAPIFDSQAAITIGDIDISPAKPDVLWVGTGEANNLRSAYAGNGLYRSADSGKTWEHVGLDGTDHIARVVAHPTNADVAFVAAMGPLYTPGSNRGIYKTGDAGKSWKKTLFVDDDTGFCDLAIDPKNPDILFAAGYECRRRAWHFNEGGDGGGIWRSTDGGDSWKKLSGGLPDGILGRIGLAIFPRDSKVMYAFVENRNPASPRAAVPDNTEAASVSAPTTEEKGEKEPDALKAEEEGKEAERKESEAKEGDAPPARASRRARGGNGGGGGDDDGSEEDVPQGPAYDDPAWDRANHQALTAPADLPANGRIKGGEVYRSDDGGDTWKCVKERLISDRASHYFYFFGQIRVHPEDANKIWVLDVGVHSSTDGGKKWNTSFARKLHSDHHALWIHPTAPRYMLLGNDGGLAQSFDGGETWDHFDTLPLAQYYAIGVDLREPYRIYGGLQDNGTWGMPSRGDTSNGIRREDVYRIGGGDGFVAVIDPTNPDTVYAESQFGVVYRYDHKTGGSKSIRPRAPKGTPALRSNWCSPIILSPHNPRTVYFGTQFVHRSFDRGDTWTIISPDLSYADQDKLAGNVPHCTITTLAESSKRAGVLWAGTDDGRVWVSKTAGERWTELTERFAGMPGKLWVTRVETSSHDADTAFVAFSGLREDDRKPYLYMTTDGGETFKAIITGLPSEPINVVRQHPRNEHVLFVGTDLRVHVSVDSGASWHPLQTGMPTNPIHDLVVHPREADLIAGAHGRGLFIMDITPFEEMNGEILGKAVHAFVPRDGILLGRGPSRGWPGQRTWSAENGETRPVFWVYVKEELAEPISLVVRDAAGKEQFTRSTIKDAGLHRVAWRSARAPRAGGQAGQARGGRRGGAAAAAPADTLANGQFVLEVTHGEDKQAHAFNVRVGPGWAPGGGFGPEEEEVAPVRSPLSTPAWQ